MRQPGFYLQPLPFSERDSRRSGTQKLLKRRCHIFVFHFAVLHGPAWPHGTPKTECQLLNRRHLKLETVGGRRFETCVLIRLPDTLRRTDSLEGRKAGKMCRKRSFSAFPPSKSALYQATGYAGKPAPRTIFIPRMASAAWLHPDLWQSFFRGAARSAAPDFAPNPWGEIFWRGKKLPRTAACAFLPVPNRKCSRSSIG